MTAEQPAWKEERKRGTSKMKGLLKFITCGSVDDGKSTLIGHILYDSKLLYTDQEKALELDSKVGSRGGKIDVAYIYFTTDNRSFIVADTPGHEEYTRNMAVGASFADLAVILLDATQGVLVQTRRHARICALMGIKYFIFAVNKMDLAKYSEERFREIEKQIEALKTELGPVSATEGDNVTKASDNMNWYEGKPILSILEQVDIDENQEEGFYLPVQRVCRPNHQFRGFQGQIESGSIKVGDEITALPSMEKAHVKSIHVTDKEVQSAEKGQPVTIQLDREVDVSRGCVLSAGAGEKVTSSVEATLLWMDDDKLESGKNYFVKLGTRLVPGIVSKILYSIDVNTGEQKLADSLGKNEIAECEITFVDRVVADEFSKHKTLGELILIDRVTNMTSACGVVTEVKEDGQEAGKKADQLRAVIKGQRAATIPFDLSDENITRSFVEQVEKELTLGGRHTYLYAPKDDEPVGLVVRHLNRAGIIVLLVLNKDLKNKEEIKGSLAKYSKYIKHWEEGEKGDVDSTVQTIRKLTEYAEDVYGVASHI